MNKKAKFGWSFGDIFMYLLIFIVGSLIVTFLVSPNSFANFKSNIKSILPSSSGSSSLSYMKNVQDPLVEQCTNSFEECLDIATTKYTSLSVKILKTEKFNDKESALEFFNTWSNPMQKTMNPINHQDTNWKTYGNVTYPVVLFSTRVNYEGVENPAVAICNSDGKLQATTKIGYMC